VHLAEEHDVAPTQHVEHPAHDLDLVPLGVDLHDVGIELGPCCEEVVERRHLYASEAVCRLEMTSRQQSRSRRMAGVQDSVATHVGDRLHDDVHVRERVELDVPAKSLDDFGVGLERDHSPRRPNEASPEKREETYVRADVEEDGARLDDPLEGVLQIHLGLARRPDRRRLVEGEEEARRGAVRDRNDAAVERPRHHAESSPEDGREHGNRPCPVEHGPGDEVEHVLDEAREHSRGRSYIVARSVPNRGEEGRARDDRRFLVTGGAGFLGSNLANELLEDGSRVAVFDSLSRPGSRLNLDWLRDRHGDALTFERGDVRDRAAVDRAMEGMDVVFHLAGQTAVTTSMDDPRADFEQNALGTLNVLEAARHSPANPIVAYASTNKVYGALPGVRVIEEETRYSLADDEAGIDERQPLDFHSPYGCSKGAADQYARDYHRVYGLRTVVLRQSCLYGPRQMGVEDQGWVAWFVIAALFDLPITIYGDGKQVRDLLYVDDAVAAMRTAVEGIDVTAGNVYNIGGGFERTVSVWREFEPALIAAVGRSVGRTQLAPARVGDQRAFYCDTSKAARHFGWEPTVGVADGLDRLAAWIRGAEPALRELVASRMAQVPVGQGDVARGS
jgi:CDP-paratose 2-epimerase